MFWALVDAGPTAAISALRDGGRACGELAGWLMSTVVFVEILDMGQQESMAGVHEVTCLGSWDQSLLEKRRSFRLF